LFHVAHAADTAPAAPTTRAATSAAAADKLGNARTLIAAKQWPAAIDELRRVNDTTSADWNNLMGYTLRKGKTPDLAASEKYYDEALRIDPDYAQAHNNLGALLQVLGHPDEAMAHYRRAVALRPDNIEARTNLGQLLSNEGLVEGLLHQMLEDSPRRSNRHRERFGVLLIQSSY